MRRKLTLTLLLLNPLILAFSQTITGVSMGTSYQYDIYYSLENGVVGSPNRTDWELAFSTSRDNNIRINSANSVVLYEVSSNLNDWQSITSISSSAIRLRNSNSDWDLGAFVSNSSGGFNFGWGDYNMETHQIEGSRIYIITYGSSVKKMMVNSLISGTYNLKIANLDSSEEETISIETSPYQHKNFIYYSLETQEIIDREPASSDWDLLFTKYEDDLNNDIANPLSYEQPYFVTGLLTNRNLIAQYDGEIENAPSILDLDTTRNINTIGWDWKKYSGRYSIVPDRSYFIVNDKEEVYEIVFKSFTGASLGNVSFSVDKVEDLNDISIESYEENRPLIYPNPSRGAFYVEWNKPTALTLKITDVRGRLHKSLVIHETTWIDLSEQSKGLYFLNFSGQDMNFTKRVLIVK
jgi:hypothetical protein